MAFRCTTLGAAAGCTVVALLMVLCCAVFKGVFFQANPNESECVARVVYPPPKADHKGLRRELSRTIGATIFAKNVKILFARY